VQGYGDSTYGEAFADVYDDWYATVTDVAATVATVVRLAGGSGRVLELGVGTGRLAVPLAVAGLDVTGIDASPAMLDRLRRNDRGRRVAVVAGDMVTDLPRGPFDVVLAAYNTLFNLLTAERQAACFAAAAERLAPGGSFVVEAFVPEPGGGGRADAGTITVRDLRADRVVLSVSRFDRSTQVAEGQYVELTESGGVRLRPWAVRYAGVDELDRLAATAGLVPAERWETFAGETFDDHSQRHVTVYRHP
jgi:SAM-dependent methyltransferase